MSLLGATGTGGSSLIDRSGSRARARLACGPVVYLFTGWRTPRKGRAARMPPANAHAGGSERRIDGRDGADARSSNRVVTVQRWVRAENCVKCLGGSSVCAGAAVNWSRPGQFFSSIVNSTRRRRLGIICSGWGPLPYRLDWKVRALTPLSSWGGRRVRRFQRDVTDQSDREGGASCDRTVGRCDAISARPCGTATDTD
jgi:hypothetical protein